MSRTLFATALLVAFPAVSAFAADDSRDGGGRAAPGAAAGEVAPERVQEKTIALPAADIDTPPPVDARAAGDNLQTARKPDESPFSEIKVLPSF